MPSNGLPLVGWVGSPSQQHTNLPSGIPKGTKAEDEGQEAPENPFFALGAFISLTLLGLNNILGSH